jgi:hypothetical protein
LLIVDELDFMIVRNVFCARRRSPDLAEAADRVASACHLFDGGIAGL